MRKTVEFIFDFVSPNGYLAWWPLKEIAQKHGAELVVTPVLLGGMHKLTGNAPPFTRDAGIKGKNEYAMLEMRRFVARHGYSRFRMNPKFPFRTVDLQRMLLAAIERGEQDRYVEAVAKALWEDGLDPGDEAAVSAVLEGAGLDAAVLAARARDGDIKQKLADNTEQAVERGTFGIPTFYVDGEMFFGKERLGQIEELLAG